MRQSAPKKARGSHQQQGCPCLFNESAGLIVGAPGGDGVSRVSLGTLWVLPCVSRLSLKQRLALMCTCHKRAAVDRTLRSRIDKSSAFLKPRKTLCRADEARTSHRPIEAVYTPIKQRTLKTRLRPGFVPNSPSTPAPLPGPKMSWSVLGLGPRNPNP